MRKELDSIREELAEIKELQEGLDKFHEEIWSVHKETL